MSETKAKAPLEVLARYFTGAEVGHNSIGLEMNPGGMMKLRERAERFFACREALGITGHMTDVEACVALAGRLSGHLKIKDPTDHRARHVLLHRSLDELFADYIRHHPDQASYLDTPFRTLMEWSHQQTITPTE